jgi:hypothetical protein
MIPISNGQSLSFFAEADQMSSQDPGRLPKQPLGQRPVETQRQQQHSQNSQSSSQLPPGRPLPFPIKQINYKGQQKPWMNHHDASLWNYVNGLVVDTSNSLNNKNELAKEASKFSTDEILSEIAATFSSNNAENDRSSSLDRTNSGNSNTSVISNITPLSEYPSPVEPQKQSYNGASFYGV